MYTASLCILGIILHSSRVHSKWRAVFPYLAMLLWIVLSCDPGWYLCLKIGRNPLPVICVGRRDGRITQYISKPPNSQTKEL